MEAPRDLKRFTVTVREFLRDLDANNSRDWFRSNKERYDDEVKRPANHLMEVLTPYLAVLAGAPVKPKLFRPHRDVRFSEDQTPYHTHVHILWNCVDGRGWFFGLSLSYASAGAGMRVFDKDRLRSYRKAVAGPAGDRLKDILATIDGRMDAPSLEHVPDSFDPGHRNADLLRREGLVVWRDDLEAALKPDPVKGLHRAFKRLAPLQLWLAGTRR